MSDRPPIPDAEARRLAQTTFTQNVVVTAGAGTGKTSLLVNRFVYLLMREPSPVDIMQVVALTFTNKAATEMKERLRESLSALMKPEADHGPARAGRVGMSDVRTQYGLSTEEVVRRATAALTNLEKAQIGTIHAFAAHLLRLFPIESGVDPLFKEDEGLRFEEHFAEQWDLWLDDELGSRGTQHAAWREVLREIDMESVRELAHALSSELVSVEELTAQVEAELPCPLKEWFAALGARTDELLAAHRVEKKARNVERALGGAASVFHLLCDVGLSGVPAAGDPRVADLYKEPGNCPRGWDESEFTEAKRLIGTARAVLTVDQRFWTAVLTLLRPCVTRIRARFIHRGWILFDGLLARARALLRDHPSIRERLKHQYRAILVDEFQDTDPVQYEMVLYLAEQPGQTATAWDAVALEPGKLFIVGDPKQSIYAFRRADIEAFDRVVEMIRRSGGEVHDLITNFRSHAAVLEVVNAVFDRLFIQRTGLQPRHVPLTPTPGRESTFAGPGVELRLVAAKEGEQLDADKARRLEADQLARWIKEDLLSRRAVTDEQGLSPALRPGHIALLFRKLTQAQDYLDALRRYEIEYVIDGEKHFYRRQEVIDLVNVLRVIENPHDEVALLGLLRSPLGGLTDREVYDLRVAGGFEVRQPEKLDGWKNSHAPAIRRLYTRLVELMKGCQGIPLPDVVDLVCARLPILELAAASLHAEQAVANLHKVRRLAADLADRPNLTLNGFVRVMIERLDEQPQESEGALAEESLEAIRVLTIHKAKGLEFPIVVVPGIHQGEGITRRESIVGHDWSSGVTGLQIKDKRTPGAVLVGEKSRAREEAERRRLLYVAMTRAKERLVLSGALVARSGMSPLMSLLEDALEEEPGDPTKTVLSVGSAAIAQTVVRATDRPPRQKRDQLPELRLYGHIDDLIGQWEQRGKAWAAARATKRSLTPTQLISESKVSGAGMRNGSGEAGRARLIGTLVHRVLERWDFHDGLESLESRVAKICRPAIPTEMEAAANEIIAEVQSIMTIFTRSQPYADLARAEILGREVPFVMSWPVVGPRQDKPRVPPTVMNGTIDLLYRLDGRLWIADYKTDQVAEAELEVRVNHYRPQAEAYKAGVLHALGIPEVNFQFVFMRIGQAVVA